MKLLSREQLNKIRLNYLSALRKYNISKKISPEEVNHFQKTVKVKSKWYGNSYGGFYVIPSMLSSGSIVYSFGIGKDISFDLNVIKSHKCEVFGFDPTPKSINWIRQQILPSQFHFYDYGISVNSGPMNFFLPADSKYVSGSVHRNNTTPENISLVVSMKSLEDITKELNHNHIDLLKMDIEGAEYEVLENIVNLSITIDQICVEFHDRNNKPDPPKSKSTVELLRKHGYELFAHSISFEEVSFVHQRKLSQ